MTLIRDLTLGPSQLAEDVWRFCVWAPRHEQVSLHLLTPEDRLLPMHRQADGYFVIDVEPLRPGARYMYRLNDSVERPDPASRCQPLGVHGPSEVVDPAFEWTDQGWRGIPLDQYIIYELHIGAFSAEGTFEGAIPHLDALVELGVTAVEIMPVAQFPGARNWGYDGVYLYAPQNSYGDGRGLKKLVDACHARGLAVILDVVYNHFGPEGNYLPEFAPYFSEKYSTTWGQALNYDGRDSDEVRHFFLRNAIYWIEEFHFDALRLDATDHYIDLSAYSFLEELADTVDLERERLGRQVFLFAESDRNDYRICLPKEQGGLDIDAQWSDSIHHAIRTLLTGDLNGYYMDYGTLEHLVRGLEDGFVYTGQYSKNRGRRHGTSARQIPPWRFVIFSQNHDQIGNRALGDRLTATLDQEGLKLAAGIVLLAPYLPLIFMGEDYGEPAPFQYFVDHGDPTLIEAVRKGRAADFKAFAGGHELPDPADPATLEHCKLNHALRHEGKHRELHELYAALIRLRKTIPALRHMSKDDMRLQAEPDSRLLIMHRWHYDNHVLAAFNFGDVEAPLTLPHGDWRPLIDSAAWPGVSDGWPSVAPRAFILFEHAGPPSSSEVY